MKRLLTSLALAAMLLCSVVMPVAASNFTPSVTAKTAPEIVPYETEGVEYAGTLVKIGEDGTETVVKDLTPPVVSVVGYADIDKEGVSDALAERMMAAYDEIAGTKDLGTLCPALVDIVKNIHKDQKTTDLVASDLFDLTLAGEELAILEGNSDVVFRITFKFNLAEGEKAPVVIHRTALGVWQAIPYESVKISGDDRITVDFSGLCPVAILRVGAPEAPAPTGSINNVFFVLGIVILAFLLIVVIRAIVVSTRRRKRRAAIIESEEGFLDGYYQMTDAKYGPMLVHKSKISIERINGDDD